MFIISISVFLLLSTGLYQMEEFEDQSVVWTPKGNPSVLNFNRSQEMFPVREGSIDLLAISKNSNKNLISKKAFEELLMFHRHLFEVEFVNPDDKSSLRFEDIC